MKARAYTRRRIGHRKSLERETRLVVSRGREDLQGEGCLDYLLLGPAGVSELLPGAQPAGRGRLAKYFDFRITARRRRIYRCRDLRKYRLDQAPTTFAENDYSDFTH